MSSALSALALMAGTAAHPQDVPTQNPTITPQFLDDFNDTIYRGLELCQMAARDDGRFIPEALASEGWTISERSSKTSAEGNPYQSVTLQHYPMVKLDVRNYPDFTSCSVVSVVLNLGHADRIQLAVEQRWGALLHEEGELKEAVLASVNEAWGDQIDVRSYDIFTDDEFLTEITHMLIDGSAIFHLDVTLLENAQGNLLTEDEKQAARKDTDFRISPPSPPTARVSPDDSQEWSRLSPPRPRTPAIQTVPPPSPAVIAQPSPSQLPTPADTEAFVNLARMCMAVVSPQQEVSTQLLIDGGWSFSQPARQSNEAGHQFESVHYYRDDLTLSLQDYGVFVQCRAGGRVSDQSETADIKAAMADHLGAKDVQEIDQLAPWRANIQRAAPGTNFDNILAIGDYSIEFLTNTIPASQIGLQEPENIHMLVISIAPFPPSFQSRTAD